MLIISIRTHVRKIVRQDMDVRLTNASPAIDTPFKLDLLAANNLSPTIMNGKIVQVQYLLEIVAKVDKCRSNISISVPVVIGTINGMAPMQPMIPVIRTENIMVPPVMPYNQAPVPQDYNQNVAFIK